MSAAPESQDLARLAELQEEDQRLLDLRVRGHQAGLVHYEEGEALLRVRKSRVYEATGVYKCAETYVADRLGCGEAMLVRRARVVEVYSRDEYAAFLHAGVPATTIVRLAEAPAEARGALEKVALQYKDDGVVEGACLAWKKERDKQEKSDEELFQKGITDTLNKRAAEKSGRCRRCGQQKAADDHWRLETLSLGLQNARLSFHRHP